MTSDPGPPPVPEETPGRAAAGSASGFGSPTGMVTLGGAILIVTYVIFGLMFNDYWVSWLAMLLAISSFLLVRGNKVFIEKVAPVPVLVKIVGYLLAVIGLLALVEDIRFADGTLNEFPDVIGALASYAGYVIAFLGARSIKA